MVSSVHALPSLQAQMPLPRPTSVSNAIHASVTPSASAAGSVTRKPWAPVVPGRVLDQVRDALRPLHGLEVPREGDEVAPVAVGGEERRGRRRVAVGERRLERAEPALGLLRRGWTPGRRRSRPWPAPPGDDDGTADDSVRNPARRPRSVHFHATFASARRRVVMVSSSSDTRSLLSLRWARTMVYRPEDDRAAQLQRLVARPFRLRPVTAAPVLQVAADGEWEQAVALAPSEPSSRRSSRRVRGRRDRQERCRSGGPMARRGVHRGSLAPARRR